MCKTSIFKIFFPCLYNFTYIAKVPIGSGSGENFPDPALVPYPTQKVRIRPDSDPDPQPWLCVGLGYVYEFVCFPYLYGMVWCLWEGYHSYYWGGVC